MKVNIEVSSAYREPEIIIRTDKVTEEINRLVAMLDSASRPIIVKKDDVKIIIKPEEIYLLRVEAEGLAIYLESDRYISKDSLKSFEERLPKNFIRISKQVIINADKLKRVEAGFNASLTVFLENSLKDYVTRNYIALLKNYLGI